MLTGDLTAVQDDVRTLRSGLATLMPRALVVVGRQLVANARQDFLVKSRGGTGADGVRWARVTPAEARRKTRLGNSNIGVRTGEMSSLIDFTTNGQNAFGKRVSKSEIVIDYLDQPKANYFNFHRPLLPPRLPNSWYRQATAIVDSHLDQLH